jgi:hypothetical protein
MTGATATRLICSKQGASAITAKTIARDSLTRLHQDNTMNHLRETENEMDVEQSEKNLTQQQDACPPYTYQIDEARSQFDCGESHCDRVIGLDFTRTTGQISSARLKME